MEDDRQQLLAILRRVLVLVDDLDNDFVWSSWEGIVDATREIRSAIVAVERGDLPKMVEVWFLPTGDLQEVGLQSGWSKEYMKLSEQFDGLWERLGAR